MHQTRGMCGMQSFGNLLDVVHRESWIEWLSAVFENLAKVLPINQAHIQVQATVDLAVTVIGTTWGSVRPATAWASRRNRCWNV